MSQRNIMNILQSNIKKINEEEKNNIQEKLSKLIQYVSSLKYDDFKNDNKINVIETVIISKIAAIKAKIQEMNIRL